VNKEKNFISAVVYVNNNESTIGYFLENLIKVLSSRFLKFEVICVNDACTDNSIEIIRSVADKSQNISISVINMSLYQGREAAMNAGVDLSIGDFVYEFDNTLIDYDLKIITDIYEKSLEGYDIVNASPKNNTHKTSKLFYIIFNKFSNNQYKINTETFRIVSRRTINRINSINKTIPYRKAIYSNCGLKLYNVLYSAKKSEKIKMNKKLKKDRTKTAFDTLILFTDVSYKISISIAFIMMFITLFVSVYTIYIFFSSDPVRGWTTTMLLLSFGFFMIFAIFTIIIKYLSIIVRMIFKNSRYFVESIDKLR